MEVDAALQAQRRLGSRHQAASQPCGSLRHAGRGAMLIREPQVSFASWFQELRRGSEEVVDEAAKVLARACQGLLTWRCPSETCVPSMSIWYHLVIRAREAVELSVRALIVNQNCLDFRQSSALQAIS